MSLDADDSGFRKLETIAEALMIEFTLEATNQAERGRTEQRGRPVQSPRSSFTWLQETSMRRTLASSVAQVLPRFSALGAVLMCSGAPVKEPAPAASLRPNVLLIVLDDLGIENLDFYGYNPSELSCLPPGGRLSNPPTPRLADIASHGVKFMRAYANPLCSPSRATILTGRHAFRTGMGTNADRGTTSYTLPVTEKTIPKVLKSGCHTHPTGACYQCGAFGKWHLSHNPTAPSLDYRHPIDSGFDTFVGTISNDGDHYEWDLVRADATSQSSTPVDATYSACLIRAEAEAWITAVSEPYFAYVCFNPPHEPFQVPPFNTVSASTQNAITSLNLAEGQNLTGTPYDHLAYNWMIESVDTELGHLIDAALAAKPNTTILIIGDNGTPKPVVQYPYCSDHAKESVYEQGVRVPFLATGYHVSTSGGTYQGVVNTVDIWRTVAALAGAPLPFVAHDSVNLTGVLLDPSTTSARTKAFVQYFEPNGAYQPNPSSHPIKNTHERAMSDGTFKYVRYRTLQPGPNGLTEQAYGLTTDPTECTNLWPVESSGLTPQEQAQVLALRTALIDLSGD